MINDKVKEVLNEQINKEFYSAYLYLAMSAYFDDIGLCGFANWTKVQAREEVDHGMIIFDYLIDRDCKVTLKQIDYPENDFSSPLQVFERILEHEKYVTSSIDCIAYMSQEECDMATRNFINWYLTEQVEEEKNASDVITKLKLFGDEKASLFLIDKELLDREYKKHTFS
ncbi:MAG: ferritin [Cyanobacteria bacterium SIG32]|nr:ferritin [Cyanobacteria bacterium SIG32]